MWTEIINRVVCFLESTGCKIHEFSNKLPDDIAGRTFYIEKEIHLNCCSSEEALYTLLHEGGHWLSYLRLRVQQGKPQPTIEQREKYALLYGWVIIKKLNLPISKETWRKYC